jgi:sugar phosphate isomerase/epimerase
MHTWMRAEPIGAAIRRIGRLDYEALEISGEPERHDIDEVRGLLSENGIRCFGSVTLMLGERNLLAANEDQRAQSIAYVNDCITMVKELGGEEISVVPATVGKITSDSTPENEWQWAVDALTEIYDHGMKSGVRIGIEPINRFETYFINRGDQALALAEAVGPECGVCLDAFHMNIEETDLLAAIRGAGDRLVDFHVADNNRMAPGMGTLDWPAIVEALQEIGYDGPLSVEFCPSIDRTPADPHPDALEREQVDISPEQKKFLEEHGSTTISETFYSFLVETSAQTLLPLL